MNSPKVRDLASSVYSRQPVGSGPYTLESWDPGVQMTFKARSDFYRASRPSTRSSSAASRRPRKPCSPSSRPATSRRSVPRPWTWPTSTPINAIPGVQAYVSAGTTIEHLDFNVENAGLADKQVRQAIAYATDRQELVDRVLAGHSSIANSIIPPISSFYNGDTPKYEYSPDKAKALLDAAGWAPAPTASAPRAANASASRTRAPALASG